MNPLSGARKCIGLVGLVSALSVIGLPGASLAYDGPVFEKGLWRFERSLEASSRNREMPNSKLVRVDRPVTRCVDPTEAMKETFRPISIGSCRSTSPERSSNTFRFANRCDHMGPVTTTISVESRTAYREVNELKVGANPRKETVVARRVGDCGSVADLASRPTNLDRADPSSFYETSSQERSQPTTTFDPADPSSFYRAPSGPSGR
jgi:hypothetical protein